MLIVSLPPICSIRFPRTTTTGSFRVGAPVQSIRLAAVTYRRGPVEGADCAAAVIAVKLS
jgi:hypothetical protein